MQDQHRFDVRAWLIWTAGFIAFPIAGIVAEAVTGRIDDAVSALVGGLAAGAVIGAGQWLVGSSARTSTTSRCARSRNSFGYFLGAGTEPLSRGFRPSTRPGAVQCSLSWSFAGGTGRT
jgi:hypothetical protein